MKRIAELLGERNAVDAEIAAIMHRPMASGHLYYSRGFPVRGRAAAQRDALPSRGGYIALHPGRVGGYPVPVAARSRAL